jgi:hypothetical protein
MDALKGCLSKKAKTKEKFLLNARKKIKEELDINNIIKR